MTILFIQIVPYLDITGLQYNSVFAGLINIMTSCCLWHFYFRCKLGLLMLIILGVKKAKTPRLV